MSKIEYLHGLESLKNLNFEGFFVNWKNQPKVSLKEILKNSSYFVIAKLDKKVIGFVTCVSDKHLCAYIPLLEVLPKYQNQKIGTNLLNKLLLQIEHLYMIDIVCDTSLNKFYENFDFKPYNACIKRNYN